jgi:hypothetical protein
MPVANCITLAGYTLDCKDNQGGIEEVYIAEFSDVTAVTDNGSGTVTAITPTGTTFYTYEVDKQNASYTENPVANQETRTLYYEQTLTFQIKKQSAAIRTEVAALMQGTLMVIVKLNTGDYKLLGRINGMDGTSNSSGGSGTAFGDLNGWTLEFSGMEPDPSYFVDSSIISNIS